MIYSLTRFERNAFLSEIVSFLLDNKDKINSNENIQKLLSQSSQYILYTKTNKEKIEEIKYKWPKYAQQIFANTYNRIYNTNKLFGQIIKIIQFKNDETIKKLNKNIIIICGNHKDDFVLQKNEFGFFDNDIKYLDINENIFEEF